MPATFTLTVPNSYRALACLAALPTAPRLVCGFCPSGQMFAVSFFQIRDDIFDYFSSKDIGKPTGNDMMEGKLTLPVLYALKHTDMESMLTLARKVKAGTVNKDEIAVLIEFTKQKGGITYAEQKMNELADEARYYIENSIHSEEMKRSFSAYLDYVIQRNY